MATWGGEREEEGGETSDSAYIPHTPSSDLEDVVNKRGEGGHLFGWLGEDGEGTQRNVSSN